MKPFLSCLLAGTLITALSLILYYFTSVGYSDRANFECDSNYNVLLEKYKEFQNNLNHEIDSVQLTTIRINQDTIISLTFSEWSAFSIEVNGSIRDSILNVYFSTEDKALWVDFNMDGINDNPFILDSLSSQIKIWAILGDDPLPLKIRLTGTNNTKNLKVFIATQKTGEVQN